MSTYLNLKSKQIIIIAIHKLKLSMCSMSMRLQYKLFTYEGEYITRKN